MSVNLTKQKLEEMVKKQLDVFLQEQKRINNELLIPGQLKKRNELERGGGDPAIEKEIGEESKRAKKRLETLKAFEKNPNSIEKIAAEGNLRIALDSILDLFLDVTDVTDGRKGTGGTDRSIIQYIFFRASYWKQLQRILEGILPRVENLYRQTFPKFKSEMDLFYRELIDFYSEAMQRIYRTPEELRGNKIVTKKQKATLANLIEISMDDIRDERIRFRRIKTASAPSPEQARINVQAAEKKAKKDIEADKKAVDRYRVIQAVDFRVAKAVGAQLQKSDAGALFSHIFSFDRDGLKRRDAQEKNRFKAIKPLVDQAQAKRRIEKIPGTKAIVDLVAKTRNQVLLNDVYSRLRSYGLRRAELTESRMLISEQDPLGVVPDEVSTDPPKKDKKSDKRIRTAKGRSGRRGRFMRGQKSFRAEFEARFGTGREGFEEFYDNLALHGIKIKEDGIFGKSHERAFKKYLVMQSKNPKITKGSETKKPEEVKAERPKYYAEKEAVEKKAAQKKKLLPPEVAKRRLRAGYTQKLQDIFQKAGTPIAWQSMYDKLKRRMVMAYTNMTGEKLDSVDEREADALMQTVLPSLASKDFRSMGELDLNLLALGRQPVFIELAGTFKRGFFIPFDTVVKKQVEEWKASFKA